MPEELWVVELKDRDVITSSFHWHAGRPLRCSAAHAQWLMSEYGAKLISKPKERAVKPPRSAEVASEPKAHKAVIPQAVKEAAQEQDAAVSVAEPTAEDKK